MNTDKLMELERKWRAEAADLMRQAREAHYLTALPDKAEDITRRADELAAALRAEQAVGEDCNCLSLMADGTGPAHLVDCPAGQPAERGAFYTCPICHSLGVVTQETFDKFMPARQSEGVVRTGNLPAPITNPEAWPMNYAEGWNDACSLMLAAAPGGEGEVDRG